MTTATLDFLTTEEEIPPEVDECPIVLLSDDALDALLHSTEDVEFPAELLCELSDLDPGLDWTLPELRAELEQERRIRDMAVEIDSELEMDPEGETVVLRVPLLCQIFAGIVTVALSILVLVGWPYYSLAVAARPFHPYHAVLRPSGTIGLSLGIVGTGLILVSLVYLARKRFVSATNATSLRNWLGFHVVTGLVGAVMIVLHANFIPYSAVGILAMVSLVIVLGSGFLGRYILVYMPRSVGGRELSREETRQRLVVYRRKMVELGLDRSLLEEQAASASSAGRRWIPTSLAKVICGDRESRREFQELKEAVKARKDLGRHTKPILQLARRLCREQQWLMRYRELRRLIGSWRFLHRWLAVVMLVSATYHIAMAVRFGHLWILGG